MRYEIDELEYIWLTPSTDGSDADWVAFKDLQSQFYKEYVHSSCLADNGDACKEENEEMQYVLVKASGDSIGFLGYSLYPKSLSTHDVYLDSLFVKDEIKGKGYGTRTMNYFIKAINHLNRDIAFKIPSYNERLQRFLNRLLEESNYFERTKVLGVETKCDDGKIFCYYIKEDPENCAPKEYVIWMRWYDEEEMRYEEGYAGFYRNKVNSACELSDCMKFKTSEEAEKWYLEYQEQLTSGERDYFEMRIIPMHN